MPTGSLAEDAPQKRQHYAFDTAIMSEGFRSLQEGQKITYDVIKGPKGLQAASVRPA